KLVHTNPDFSTAGLSSVVAEYYAATGKKEGLTEKDVSGAGARSTVKGIEKSIVHYGDTTIFISDQLLKEGPGYASAVAPEDAAHGADPAQPTRVLGLPEPRVLDLIRRTWREDRKPANVLLVLDTSGSMNEEGRLEHAKAGLETFLRNVSPNDRVGLTIFSDR